MFRAANSNLVLSLLLDRRENSALLAYAERSSHLKSLSSLISLIFIDEPVFQGFLNMLLAQKFKDIILFILIVIKISINVLNRARKNTL